MQKIMFNDKLRLTEATINGTKTQTRRIITADYFVNCTMGQPQPIKKGVYRMVYNGQDVDIKPQYKVGEIVAVAQCYRNLDTSWKLTHVIPMSCAAYDNKMFVKAELMQHFVKITNVRIERLQDITDEDCIKEGVINFNGDANKWVHYCPKLYYSAEVLEDAYPFCSSPKHSFATLIDAISGKGTWEDNPFVWVYEYELTDKKQ